MDIEGISADCNWRNVFHPIQQFPLHLLQQKKVSLQNVFHPTAKDSSLSLVLSVAE
jgi:hypothetical protein